MRNLMRAAAVAVLAAAIGTMFAMPASGHDLDRSTISCTTVSGTFHDFGSHDHPVIWHIAIGNAPSQTIATTESPQAFVGTGTASADISALTATLQGSTATVHAYATWPGGQSAVTTDSLTCGTAPVTAPPQVGGIEVQAPSAQPAVSPAATPVPLAATFAG